MLKTSLTKLAIFTTLLQWYISWYTVEISVIVDIILSQNLSCELLQGDKRKKCQFFVHFELIIIVYAFPTRII